MTQLTRKKKEYDQFQVMVLTKVILILPTFSLPRKGQFELELGNK